MRFWPFRVILFTFSQFVDDKSALYTTFVVVEVVLLLLFRCKTNNKITFDQTKLTLFCRKNSHFSVYG